MHMLYVDVLGFFSFSLLMHYRMVHMEYRDILEQLKRNWLETNILIFQY